MTPARRSKRWRAPRWLRRARADQRRPENASGSAAKRPPNHLQGWTDFWQSRRLLVAIFAVLAILVGAAAAYSAIDGAVLSAAGKSIRELLPHDEHAVKVQVFEPAPSNFLVPLGVDALPAPPSSDCTAPEVVTWARDLGGVDAYALNGGVIFTGQNDGASRVVVTGIQASRKQVDPAVGLSSIVCGIGGQSANYDVTINLDEAGSTPGSPAISWSRDGQPIDGPPTFEIDADGEVFLAVDVVAYDGTYMWTAQLVYSVDGERKTAPLSSDPHILTGVTQSATQWDGSGWAVVG